MIRATHIARPRKLKHTKQRLSSNLRRRSRPALSAANQTWRVGTDAALGPNFAPHVQSWRACDSARRHICATSGIFPALATAVPTHALYSFS